MLISKKKFIMHSIGFRIINLGLVIILLVHFLFPGLIDGTALFGYSLLIIGTLFISFTWKEFRVPFLFFTGGLILSALALRPLSEEGIGLLVYMEYTYKQIGMYWGIPICFADMIGMFTLVIMIKKRANGDGQARTYSEGDDMLYAKLRGKAIGDSKTILISFIVLVPAFIGRIATKVYTGIISASASGINSNEFAFKMANMMIVTTFFLVLLIPSIVLICRYFFEVSTSVKELMKDADGKNKMI